MFYFFVLPTYVLL